MGLAIGMRQRPRAQALMFVVVVSIVVIVGMAFVISRAASSFGSVEAENATISGNGPVTVGTDAAASGGKYIQFSPAQ